MMEPLPERRCAFCDDPFTPRTSKQIYDVLDCRYRMSRQRAREKREAEKASAARREAERRAAMATP
jgi:hypothetical protein